MLMKQLVFLGTLLILMHSAGPAWSQSDPDAISTAGDTRVPQKILVHLTHGPEHPTRAALAFAVAKAALDEGHSVSMFLAGDAVQLIRDGVLDNLNGLGTGNLRELYDGIVARGGAFYLSGGSSKARGVTDRDIGGKPVEFASPLQLVRLSLEHDRMFTY
jgi:predicted peroxiredoxin